MDCHMPGMDGYKTAKYLKKISPNCPIIIVSGDEPEVRKGKKYFDKYLKKPFSYQSMNEILNNLVS